MAKYERERKFLLDEDKCADWRRLAVGHVRIEQGYLSRRKESTVRVRIAGEQGWLTVKGITSGDTREEYEYEVPVADARRIMNMCEGLPLEKERWIVPWEGMTWEVDIFGGQNSGLKLCEVELPLAFDGDLSMPPFVGEEVTGDVRYYNSALVSKCSNS